MSAIRRLEIYIFVLICIQISNAQTNYNEQILDRFPEEYRKEIKSALDKRGENVKDLLQAIQRCPENQAEALGFLLANMPERDLTSLDADFLLRNVALSYQALDSVKWAASIPQAIFLNYVLPYVNLHERRDDWRGDFFSRFLPLVRDMQTAGEAAVKLNNEIWDLINVHYSTKRPKADQSPYESMDATLASCTGLSILLIDACRAVGIPARFVGVPLWADHSGNHSWVEIWDNGWHYIGAAEPGPLDKSWFAERAELSNDSEWKYSIYAASFKKTKIIFPALFDSSATYVSADIITDFYSKKVREEGHITLAVRLFDRKGGLRIKGKITVSQDGQPVGEGYSRDERHDFNDFLIFKLMPDQHYQLHAEADGLSRKLGLATTQQKYQVVEIYLKD